MVKPNEVFIIRRGNTGFVYPPLVAVGREEKITFTAVNTGANIILPRSLYDHDIRLDRTHTSEEVALKSEAPLGLHLYSVQLEDAADFAKAGSSPIIIIRDR